LGPRKRQRAPKPSELTARREKMLCLHSIFSAARGSSSSSDLALARFTRKDVMNRETGSCTFTVPEQFWDRHSSLIQVLDSTLRPRGIVCSCLGRRPHFPASPYAAVSRARFCC